MPPKTEIPKRKAWQDLKKKYGVPDGATVGVKVGDELDLYWKSISSPKTIVAAAARVEEKLATYIKKIDKKKVKDYPKFEKEFLDNFLAPAHLKGVEMKRMAADKKIIQGELANFFNGVTKLDPAKSSLDDLQKFKSGPLRGLYAVGKSARGVDLRDIDKLCAPLNDGIDKLPKDISQQDLGVFVKKIFTTAKAVQADAKDKGILA